MAEIPTKLNFELVSPSRLLVSEEAEMVVVPGAEGDFGVLPQHAPLISTVRPGLIDIYEGGKIKAQIFVAGGFAEVTGERLIVLAEEAIPRAEIERQAAEQRLKDAEDDLKDAQTEADKRRAEKARDVAQLLVEIASKSA